MATCPDALELDRSVSEPAGDALAVHLTTCMSCRRTRDGLVRVMELARELSAEEPTPARRREVRAALVAAAAEERMPARATRRPVEWSVRSSRARGVLSAAAAVVAIALVVYLARPARSPAPAVSRRGMVAGHAGARFVASSPLPDEVVRLEEGVIDVEVRPLRPGERFRVVVGDAEVEVHGTAFEVTAQDDRLVGVEVRHGVVEVRVRGGAPMLLGGGQAWRPQVAAATLPPPAVVPVVPVVPAGSPPRSRPRAVAPRSPLAALPSSELPTVVAPPSDVVPPTPTPAPRAADELAYDEAWTAMRAGRFGAAATSFARVSSLAPAGALAEDASFWHAVALARAERGDAAVSAFRAFVRRHPRSSRAAEASAMLGWLLIDRGEPDEARRYFRAASDDSNPAIRDSARAGLDALDDAQRR